MVAREEVVTVAVVRVEVVRAPTLFPVKMASRPSCAGALREDTEDTGGFVVVVVV